MDHEHPVLLGECHNTFKKGQVDHLRRRVVGERDDHHLRFRPESLHGALGAVHEIALSARKRYVAHVGPRDDHRIRVDGIGGVRHHRDVPGPHDRHHEVGNPFLGADRGDRLGIRVEVDVVLPLVPRADGLPQLRDPPREGIPVVAGVSCRLDELVHDVLGSGQVGIPHPEVDDVLPRAAHFRFELGDHRKNVGWQTLDPWELFHSASPGKIKEDILINRGG